MTDGGKQTADEFQKLADRIREINTSLQQFVEKIDPALKTQLNGAMNKLGNVLVGITNHMMEEYNRLVLTSKK